MRIINSIDNLTIKLLNNIRIYLNPNYTTIVQKQIIAIMISIIQAQIREYRQQSTTMYTLVNTFNHKKSKINQMGIYRLIRNCIFKMNQKHKLLTN